MKRKNQGSISTHASFCFSKLLYSTIDRDHLYFSCISFECNSESIQPIKILDCLDFKILEVSSTVDEDFQLLISSNQVLLKLISIFLFCRITPTSVFHCWHRIAEKLPENNNTRDYQSGLKFIFTQSYPNQPDRVFLKN